MRDRNRRVGVCGVAMLAVALLVAVGVQAGERDLATTAQRLVDQCAHIEEGDRVLVHGTTEHMDLLEEVVVHVRKRGAFPLLTVTNDDLIRRMFMEIPSKYDGQHPELDIKLAGIMDAAILVTATENPALLADVPEERLAARGKAREHAYNAMLKHNVRIVGLGNALYPTKATARQFGISQERLADIFWKGVNVDYRELQAATDTVRTYLAAGNSVRITADNGTDLRMRIQGRPVHVNDGVISPDDRRAGGAACQVWLPAGEVFLTPLPDTAEGTIVVDRHYFRGKEIRGLRLEFQAGRLASMTAQSGIEPLKRLYDACGAGKDRFAALDVGVNPNVRIPPDSRMVAWMASGMVTVGVGTNKWAGGDVSSDFALFTHLPMATLEVDGRKLIDKGTLQP